MTQPETPDLEIRLTRAFHAPPGRVFAAWTDPARLARLRQTVERPSRFVDGSNERGMIR